MYPDLSGARTSYFGRAWQFDMQELHLHPEKFLHGSILISGETLPTLWTTI